LTNKKNSRRKDRKSGEGILPLPSRANATEILATDFVQRRAFHAIADYFERLHRAPFTVSQAVSIARALRPYAEQEARRRQAHGATAPGRCRIAKLAKAPEFKSREFIARCVGFAPATLRKAEIVIKAAERDPGLIDHVKRMDFDRRPGKALGAIARGARPNSVIAGVMPRPAGRRFGERLVEELMSTALRPFGPSRKRVGSRSGNLPPRAPKRSAQSRAELRS